MRRVRCQGAGFWRIGRRIMRGTSGVQAGAGCGE